jgi:nucleoside-triphosphatase THEP1
LNRVRDSGVKCLRLTIPKGYTTDYIDLKTQWVQCGKLKYQVLIVHGEIASGKTHRAEQIVDRAKVNGFNVHGILSKRVILDRDTIGYDLFDVQSGKSQPMVYHSEHAEGDGWEPLRGPFVYNVKAFEESNRLLVDAAYQMDKKSLVVADEYGHLEARGFGLYQGLCKVVEALGEGKLLVICRTNKIDDVLRLFNQNETRILVMEVVQKVFMETLADSFI